MYRIRFHGRGGQGIKTASRILGSALFSSGYEVQDAARYGAERRGAPMFAYVRADRTEILERGIVVTPDLLLVADETLINVAAAAVLDGIESKTVIVIASKLGAAEWQDRLRLDNRVFCLPRPAPKEGDDIPDISGLLAGAAARLLGVVSEQALAQAVKDEIAPIGDDAVAANLINAQTGFAAMVAGEGCVSTAAEQKADDYTPPGWVDLGLDSAATAAPNIYAGLTSVKVRTGLWRVLRPVVDESICKKCVWVCGSACPDAVINVSDAGYPVIDYAHCKGCMICVVQCPRHAIASVSEADALASEGAST